MTTIEISADIKLVTHECFRCHIIFAMPKFLDERAQKFGDTFYCPNGHGAIYTESEVFKLKHQLEATEADREIYRQQRDDTLILLSKKNKEIQRIQKRIHAGVCPECKRHFVNLERHMQGKHGGLPERR